MYNKLNELLKDIWLNYRILRFSILELLRRQMRNQKFFGSILAEA